MSEICEKTYESDNSKKAIIFNSLIPELSVSDIEKSKKFYLELGFVIKYERTENKFCFLELENNQIMIEEENDNWNVGKLEYPYGRASFILSSSSVCFNFGRTAFISNLLYPKT